MYQKLTSSLVIGALSFFVVACSTGTTSNSTINKKLPIELRPKPGAPFILKQVTEVTKVTQLTGADSMNKTNRYDVYGQDLGSMFNVGNKTYLVFGDTYGVRPNGMTGGGGSDWRSNTLAVTTDSEPSNGLTFDTMITGNNGDAKELLPSLKFDNQEITKIPTYGVSVGKTLYLYYMSVKHWGDPGKWAANNSGIAKSVDSGQNWTFITSAKWPGNSNFVQVSIDKVKIDKNHTEIYFWGIPAGRFGGVELMKVDAKSIEDITKYQYFAGVDKQDNPIWSDKMADAVKVVNDTVGELSVIWDPYLQRWIMMYLNGTTTNIVMREGMTPWGPWGKSITVATQEQYPGLYGPFMNPRYMVNNGQSIYFTLSLWGPYNVFWMKATLVK